MILRQHKAHREGSYFAGGQNEKKGFFVWGHMMVLTLPGYDCVADCSSDVVALLYKRFMQKCDIKFWHRQLLILLQF